MWWLFERLSESQNVVLYAYSRENRNLDGRVSIDTLTEEASLIQPSSEDAGSSFCERKALEKALRLINRGYPQHEMIACG